MNRLRLHLSLCQLSLRATHPLSTYSLPANSDWLHAGIEQRAGVKDSLAPSRVGDSRSKKRLILRKIRAEGAHQRGKLQSLRTKKIERLGHEVIDPDPCAKRTAGRVAAAPALQSNPIGPASCTPQAHACDPLEYPHLAVPRAHNANSRRRFCRALCRNRHAPHLNLARTIAMYHEIHTYPELQQQIHDDLRIQHPEWVESNGECPRCDSYETLLTEMLDTLTRTGSNGSIAATHRALEQGVN